MQHGRVTALSRAAEALFGTGSAAAVGRPVAHLVEAEAARRDLMFARAERIGRMGSWEWRPGEGRLRWSEGHYRLLGFEPGEVAPTTELLLDHTHEDDRERVGQALDRLAHEGELPPLAFRIRRCDGAVRHVVATMAMAEGIPGDGLLMTGSLQDVTERRVLEDRLVQQAFHDPLTDLPNRRLFLDRLEHAVERSRRAGDRLAVLLIDVDDFKTINDGLGHEAGDQLLTAARAAPAGRHARQRHGRPARRRRVRGPVRGAAVRARRRPAGRAAGHGLDGAVHRRRARALHHGEHRHRHQLASATRTPPPCCGRPTRRCTAARRTAAGGASSTTTPCACGPGQRLRAEQDLRAAFEREEFRLAYQPVVSLADGRPVGVEALLRLPHPERGLLPAAEFIPLCEELGLLGPLGRWALERACRDLAAWDRTHPGGRRLRLFLNVSARQFAQSDIVEQIACAAAVGPLAPDRLSVDITETAVLEDVAAATQRLRALRELGVQTMVDDFGTGYSALGYLLRLPLDGLKIDRAFVHALGPREPPAAIVSAIVELAAGLGMTVVAEGVEDGEQLREVRRLGCDLAQGYHVARPVPAADAARWATA